MNANKTRHSGEYPDADAARPSGPRAGWAELSTGVNPVPCPSPGLPPEYCTALPDVSAINAVEKAARAFRNVPDNVPVPAAPGARAFVARIPVPMSAATVAIPGPTCTEHAAVFPAHGQRITRPGGDALVAARPIYPGDRLWSAAKFSVRLTGISHSITDVASSTSHVNLSTRPGTMFQQRIGRILCVLAARLGHVVGGTGLVTGLAGWLCPGPVQTVRAAP